MKYLSTYIEQAQTDLFKKTGTFFAFSDKQYKEKAVSGVKYVSLGSGVIVPKENAKTLMDELENIHKKGIAQDIKENGKEAIIQRELANHEAQITMDIDDTIAALDGYGFSVEDIQEGYEVFFKHCVDNDLF